ncbi:MAG TPA: Sec-independent protein translocase protein TatB [Methylococcaceae bacterium]|nr:Sec-independent protein translocase protein TatB [Methylococcaceae bacterium]
MFDIGFWELVVVGLVTLLAFGPRELPRLVRDTLRLTRRLRAAAQAASTELRRELQLDDLESTLDDTNRHLRSNLLETPATRQLPSPDFKTPDSPASKDD